MIHTTLVASLAAFSPPQPSLSDVCLDLLPPDAAVVVRIDGMADVLGKSDEDKGAWERFITDARVSGAVAALLDEAGASETAFQNVGALAASIKGGAIGLIPDESDQDDVIVVGVLQTEDNFPEALKILAESEGASVLEPELLGRPAVRMQFEGPGEQGLVFLEAGGLWLMVANETGAMEDPMRMLLANAEDGPTGEGWWSTAPGRIEGAQMEVLAKLSKMPVDDEEFQMVADVLDTVCVTMRMGEENMGDMSMSIGFHENKHVSNFEAALGEPKLSDLDLAPEGAMAVQIGNIDFAQLIDATVTLIDAVEPGLDAAEQYEMAIEAANGAVGIDIEEDIIANLTGNIFAVQWPVDDLTGLEEEDPALIADFLPVFGFEFTDPEPFLELIDIAMGFAGPIGAETTDTDTATVMTVPLAPGAEFSVYVTETHLVIGGDAERVEDVLARASGDDKSEGAFTAAELAKAKEESMGGVISIVDMGLNIQLLLGILEMGDDEMGEVPEELFEVLEAFEEHLGITSVMEMSMNGNLMTMRSFSR